MNVVGSSETPLHFIYRYNGLSVGRYRRYPSDYSSSVVFPLLKKDHIAKGIDQKNPPIVPIATTVTKVIGSEFGIPKRGPNKGIIDVMHPTGIRILRLTSGHLARFDI